MGSWASTRRPSLAGMTSNSIMCTPISSAASKLSKVLPGAIRSAPLCPTRLTGGRCSARVIAGTRAPERVAIVVALPAEADRRVAAAAGQGAALEDPPLRTAAVHRAHHQRPDRADDAHGLRVARLLEPAPGAQAGQEAALRLPDSADPGDDPLVEQSVAYLPRSGLGPQAAEELRLAGLRGPPVGPGGREGPGEAGGAPGPH